MTTWRDHSSRSVVVGCSRCPSWRVTRPTTAAAWTAAAVHARDVHGPKSAECQHAHKNAHRRATGTDPGKDGKP